MDLLRTDLTYKTRANALAKLDAALARLGRTRDGVRWLVATNDAGRFAPVVLAAGPDMALLLPLAHMGVTVVG